LQELLSAFGIDEARARLAKNIEEACRHAAMEPSEKAAMELAEQLERAERKIRLSIPPAEKDPGDREQEFWQELKKARPVLELLAQKVHRLAGFPTLIPDEYRAQREAIVKIWNNEIDNHGWKMLPPLCEACGLPVLRRQSVRLGDGRTELSKVCDESCRLRLKSRDKSQRQRQRNK